MTTEAVLCPTPGSSSKAENEAGTFPWCFSIRIFERFQIAFPLVLLSPQGRICCSNLFELKGKPSPQEWMLWQIDEVSLDSTRTSVLLC